MPDGDTLSYSLLGGPEGLTVDSGTGEVLWNPAITDLGTTQIALQVEDGHGGIEKQIYTLSVKTAVTNRSPVITTVPVVDAEVTKAYLYDVDAVDADQNETHLLIIKRPGRDDD